MAREGLSLSLVPGMFRRGRQDLGMNDLFAALLGMSRGFTDTYCRDVFPYIVKETLRRPRNDPS